MLICTFEKCTEEARYGNTDKTPIFCRTHNKDKLPLTPIMCRFLSCVTIPVYNFDGLKKGLYCNTHKLDGMEDVRNMRCLHKGCKKQPCFNYPGKKSGLYCDTHKLPNMEDVKHARCLYTGCETRPSYNFDGLKIGIYCETHKLKDMEDVLSSRCAHTGCKTHPVFNFAGMKTGLYCEAHKLPNMENVVHPRCPHENCKTQPTFNFKGLKRLYCGSHKLLGMENVSNDSCEFNDCKTLPRFNYEEIKIGRFCNAHKLDNMINVIDKTCINDWCSTQVGKKYEGYCLFCFIHAFPDKPVTRNYKTKESTVALFVKSKFPNFTWITDKRITDGCSKRRPDLFLDLGYQVIIVEVDENQHQSYDCSCENKRLMEISQDIGHRPLIFIRFNPDEYDDIDSCWHQDRLGFYVVRKFKTAQWSDRLDALAKQIDYWSDPKNVTDKTVEVIQLFYDTKINDK